MENIDIMRKLTFLQRSVNLTTKESRMKAFVVSVDMQGGEFFAVKFSVVIAPTKNKAHNVIRRKLRLKNFSAFDFVWRVKHIPAQKRSNPLPYG